MFDDDDHLSSDMGSERNVDICLGLLEHEAISSVRQLTRDEYQRVREASIALTRFGANHGLLEMVQWNFQDYMLLFEQYVPEFFGDASRFVIPSPFVMRRAVIDANRRILNFLYSFRTFLDHWETKLKRRYGKDSEQVRRFKAACSDAYDSCFSYRFIYKLRNYAQHYEMPLGNLSLSQRTNQDLGKKDCEIALYFSRESLLTDPSFDWGSPLRGELLNLSPKFEIAPHINKAMECIERIYKAVLEDELPILLSRVEYLEHLVEPLKGREGQPVIIKTDIQGSMSLERIPLWMIETIKTFDVRMRAV